MLDDRHCGLGVVESSTQSGITVDVVVVGHLLTLQLLRARK